MIRYVKFVRCKNQFQGIIRTRMREIRRNCGRISCVQNSVVQNYFRLKTESLAIWTGRHYDKHLRNQQIKILLFYKFLF